MHKPNKIPGMKTKGIDRKRDRSGHIKKQDNSHFLENVRRKKDKREETLRLKQNEGTNKRSSGCPSEFDEEAWRA
jgi:hypothetical protein